MRCGGPTFEFPGEAAADKQPSSGTSGLQARRRAAHFALLRGTVSGYSGSAPPAVGKADCDFRFEARIKGRRYAKAQSALTNTVSAPRPSGTRWQRQCSAGSLPPYAASLRVGPVPPVVCRSKCATPLPDRSSKVRLRRVHPGPLFLHTSAGKNPAGSVPDSPGAAVPAAGAACTHRYQDAKVIP